MYLTEKQIQLLLAALASKYGPGWSDKKEVTEIQMMLSIELEIKRKKLTTTHDGGKVL